MSTPSNPLQDHGIVVPKKRLQISWVWLFPVMAASAAGYMFAHDWLSRGPEIVIDFLNTPGIRADKTELIYRGVAAGIVDKVELDAKLEKVSVHVRLKKSARGIAREGSTFWIDQPVISLSGASGIDSLINGNSIQASMGTGAFSAHFTGSENAPVVSLNKIHDLIRLRGAIAPYLDAGSQVYFRGVVVGVVRTKALDEHNQPYLDVLIDEQYEDLLRGNARFWITSPTSVKIGSGVLKIDFSGLKTLLFGAINFDFFGDMGDRVSKGAEFQLYDNATAARANSEPIILEFNNAQGILPGETQLRYLGVPVGIVEKVKPANGKALVTARLVPGYETLRSKGSVFSVTRPVISLQKVSGLETLVSGIYIDCIPGAKGPAVDRFKGVTQEQAALIQPGDPGFRVVLNSPSTKIGVGSEVRYRGITVGRVIKKALSPDGQNISLTLTIDNQYAPLLHVHSRFWDSSGVNISGGLISLNVRAPALESSALTCIDFATPEGVAMGDPVQPGHVYTLFSSPKKDWLQWMPDIPLAR
jgi:paraquat-inducible protein B